MLPCILYIFSWCGFLEGNLWKELWETAKPIAAVEQTPIYDEDLAMCEYKIY
jgi:hypothetical protein